METQTALSRIRLRWRLPFGQDYQPNRMAAHRRLDQSRVYLWAGDFVNVDGMHKGRERLDDM
jgi:hypothetical protein